MTQSALKTTQLHSLHERLGAKMVPFAGYHMPVQYDGVLGEHTHTRKAAGLFDVGHMGQATLTGLDGRDPGAALEALVPGAMATLKPGRTRYTLLLNDEGGIRDDLMVTRLDAETLYLVVNAACKDTDFAHIAAALDGQARLDPLTDRGLVALQGPRAAEALAGQVAGIEDLTFMQASRAEWREHDLLLTRSGYTGEDGFEISVPNAAIEAFVEALLAHDSVKPVGLGARDSLRLEAGLCLYGHDLDEATTPVEADLVWAIGKKRRETGGFPGFTVIRRQMEEGITRRRVGLRPEGRTIAREGSEIVDDQGQTIGRVTSGSFAPSVGGPVAMGYVRPDFAAVDTPVGLKVRGKVHPARVAATPFVAHRYVRG
ncbi:aminomethyltransferase [Rhodothalassium salexigens DSM 2132]|uniref:aminomethyltransferase n=1 Tax=Rhodothalassium salexigens DSM 2132 TaxID=1188247 RepID=A0A4V2SQC9_RHOSA|nr:glycine cleavage system aminomethyltransferase GcvT [Rhodothalassium salexigens]MBB4210021.1 aminomethyltransferase [Rhodothalassium salexigens DSM 2132]MBK1637608.1 glycine cleavage system protein T [Rhodothalassium salexigens DSM 2132]TCP38186.1 aminomethyltransferase [Rhodothalassium salexigens DSM 2132]